MDYKWICPCTFFYLLLIFPSIILLEYNSYQADCAQFTSPSDQVRRDLDGNFTNFTANLVKKTKDILEIELQDDQWLLGIHQFLLFLLVIGRWLLPRGYNTIRYMV